ncbi:N-acetylmuramoyl-L-alanine amidase [Streptomyces sudanensis]|uniref:N-acetylmuramoyl-L-alanine amidase n=1 Tax=Streptomyces sudanensis TaxID=436397 RepID=UPI0020CE6905|nr:N-acetylmuramoyl-L-alanine amidase [Streptomyces sudanensis]MCQ0000756.1 N-acetylmuramoyl-L-alanine amidase [Streptomyces sudanensis]
MRSIRVPLIGVAVAVATASGSALALPLPPSAPAAATPAAGDAPDPGSTRSLPLAPLPGHERSEAPGTRAAQGLPRRDVEPFSLLGVVWDEPDAELHGTVQVRTRSTATGAWSPWQDLEVHQHDHAADPGTAEARSQAVRGGTAPLWVGDSDGVEVRVRPGASGGDAAAAPLPRGLRVELVHPGDGPADGAEPGARSAARDADAAPQDGAPQDGAPQAEPGSPAPAGTATGEPAEPGTTEPDAAEPPTDPGTAAESAAAEPGADGASGTAPPAADGATTEPGGTEPGTTEPATDGATTDPGTAEPGTTDPPAEPGGTAQDVPGVLTAAEAAASAANADLVGIGATEIPELSKAQTEEGLPDTTAAKPYIGPRPRIVTRKGWGADEKLREPGFVYTKAVQVAFVHHSATGNNYTCAQAPSVLRGVYRYHTQSLGWRDLGYNFAVDKCGTVYEGRAGGVTRSVQGAHTMGFNTATTGIVVLGSFSSTAPPAQAVTGVARLTAWKLGIHAKDPRGRSPLVSGGGNLYKKGTKVQFNNVSGHRDGYSTACPGAKLYARLGAIRSTAAKYQGRP